MMAQSGKNVFIVLAPGLRRFFDVPFDTLQEELEPYGFSTEAIFYRDYRQFS
jgi:hypothetical protein